MRPFPDGVARTRPLITVQRPPVQFILPKLIRLADPEYTIHLPYLVHDLQYHRGQYCKSYMARKGTGKKSRGPG
jgi:hypothetical protein